MLWKEISHFIQEYIFFISQVYPLQAWILVHVSQQLIQSTSILVLWLHGIMMALI